MIYFPFFVTKKNRL